MSDPHLKMTTLTLSARHPTEVGAVAQLATQLVLEDVVAGKVTSLLLLAFRGNQVSLWQLHDLPAPDDVVRTIVQRDAPEAVAFVYPTPLPPEVEGERGYTVAVETSDGKADTLIALRGGDGLGGDHVRLYARTLEGVPARWLGVAPESNVQLWFEGPVGLGGPRGEA